MFITLGSLQKHELKEEKSSKDRHFMSEAEKKYRAYIKSAITCPGLSDAMQEFFRHREPLVGKLHI